MRITIVGSGDAFGGSGCNAAALVDEGLLIDCGAPVHVLLPKAGGDIDQLDTLLLTHFHADHTALLPVVLGALSRRRAGRGLSIGGPVGVREHVSRLVRTGYGDASLQRIVGDLPVRWCELQDGSDITINDRRVRATAMVHSIGPSLSYAITAADGVTVGITGDTGPCAGLDRLAAAVDLLVCECSGWTADAETGHLDLADVAVLHQLHPDLRILLTHLGDRGPVDGMLVAHDGLTLDITPTQAARPTGV